MSTEQASATAVTAGETQNRQQDEEYGLWDFIWSDYETYCDYRESAHAAHESDRVRRLKLPLRFIINPVLRAQALFRITLAAPPWIHWFWRSLLMHTYACELLIGARIGPNLSLPHPIGIAIGGAVRIGRGVTIGQHVTMAVDMKGTGAPQVGDNVILLAGSVLAGPIRIGDGALVGANAVVVEDVPAGGMCRAARSEVTGPRAAGGSPAGSG